MFMLRRTIQFLEFFRCSIILTQSHQCRFVKNKRIAEILTINRVHVVLLFRTVRNRFVRLVDCTIVKRLYLNARLNVRLTVFGCNTYSSHMNI